MVGVSSGLNTVATFGKSNHIQSSISMEKGRLNTIDIMSVMKPVRN